MGVEERIQSATQSDGAAVNDRLAQVSAIFPPILARGDGRAVFLYGSRASGKARPYSDFDFGLVGIPKVGSGEYLALLEEVLQVCDDRPWKISFLNFDQAPARFLASMQGSIQFVAGDRRTFSAFSRRLGRLRGVHSTANSPALPQSPSARRPNLDLPQSGSP